MTVTIDEAIALLNEVEYIGISDWRLVGNQVLPSPETLATYHRFEPMTTSEAIATAKKIVYQVHGAIRGAKS